MARPTKYSAERAAAICADIERGNTFRVAALCNGIAYETFRVWREAYPAFSAAIEAAEAKAQREVVRMLELKIHEGATDLIKFYLTHWHSDGWHPPATKHQIGGDPDNPTPWVLERTVFAPAAAPEHKDTNGPG